MPKELPPGTRLASFPGSGRTTHRGRKVCRSLRRHTHGVHSTCRYMKGGVATRTRSPSSTPRKPTTAPNRLHRFNGQDKERTRTTTTASQEAEEKGPTRPSRTRNHESREDHSRTSRNTIRKLTGNRKETATATRHRGISKSNNDKNSNLPSHTWAGDVDPATARPGGANHRDPTRDDDRPDQASRNY